MVGRRESLTDRVWCEHCRFFVALRAGSRTEPSVCARERMVAPVDERI